MSVRPIGHGGEHALLSIFCGLDGLPITVSRRTNLAVSSSYSFIYIFLSLYFSHYLFFTLSLSVTLHNQIFIRSCLDKTFMIE